MLWIEYCCKVRLLGYPPHLLVAKNRCHLIPSSVLKHHWSRASILLASTFVIAHHSDQCRKIHRIQVLYNFSFVGIAMRDFQKWLSVLCIIARVIPLRRMMSGVFCVDEWMTEPRYINWSTTATCWSWTVMVDGTFTMVPKAWTFVFCQFTLNLNKVASLAFVSSIAIRSSSSWARRETSSVKSRTLTHSVPGFSFALAVLLLAGCPQCICWYLDYSGGGIFRLFVP